ncbi:MAG: Glu/Leu/Phe/Val dehydrogenase dimerization domain-containing protein [bacterium]|nr:Glu/Leu/Phe/Val dehydrogenase dimerization domain-containing protein [bacterium]
MSFRHSFDVEKLVEYDNHHKVVFLNDSNIGLKGFIGIHRKNKKFPSFGATRLWPYSSQLEAIKDVLRLSKLMSYKAAMAGLPYGGAKAVISGSVPKSSALLKAYAERVNLLEGLFITGSDIGLTQADVKTMSRTSPFMVGSKIDPTEFTGLGLFYGLEAALREVFGEKDVTETNFAIAGLGKVGSEFLKLIYSDNSNQKIFVSDIDKDKVKSIEKRFPKVIAISPSKIHEQRVDVYSPCAMSGILNNKTIKELRCQIVLGGANNQLANDKAGELLYRSGILYAPDYVVNAGGLISVVSEYENKINKKLIINRVKMIKKTLGDIFVKSSKMRKSTDFIADSMARAKVDAY